MVATKQSRFQGVLSLTSNCTCQQTAALFQLIGGLIAAGLIFSRLLQYLENNLQKSVLFVRSGTFEKWTYYFFRKWFKIWNRML